MSTSVAFTGVPVARTAPKRHSCQIGVSCRAALPRWNAEAPLLKAGAAAAAAALFLALPASAGPLSDLLPNSSPKTENNMKLFERDLGEGRKLVPEPDQVKDDKSRLPAPLPFKKAERATPDMKFLGGDEPLPGIAKSNAKAPVSAPLTGSQA